MKEILNNSDIHVLNFFAILNWFVFIIFLIHIMYFVIECEEMRNIKSAILGILHNMIKSDCVNKNINCN